MKKIVTKPGIIIDVVGSYFYDKKIMTENGLFVLGGPETQLHDILWDVHDRKNLVEPRVRKILGSSPLRWPVRGRAMRVSLVRTRVCARRCALIEPERLHYRLRVTEPERSIDGY